MAPKAKSKRRFAFTLHLLSHVIGFLWIAPIVALLVLNYKKHVIGASIWCPRGKCNAEAYGDNAISKASKLDAEDHNILGALQFVSKGLEVWFMVVATALVYDVALFLAKSSNGLPIGYLFTHLEFGDLRNLVNPLLWTSPIPHGNLMPSKPSGTWKLYLFALLAAFLTILTNLMGPATAVLVLPTLQWVDTAHKADQVFGSFAASSPPTGDTVFPGCNDTQQLLARNYSCTSSVSGPSMDNWLSQTLSTVAQWSQNHGDLRIGTTQEGDVQFTVNATTGDLVWIPSRQVLRSLSRDYDKLFVYVTGQLPKNDTVQQNQPSFNNSLQTYLQREGPSLGLQADCFSGDVVVRKLAEDREVRCLDGWTSTDDTNYTKCYRAGTGWGESNQVAGFFLGDAPKRANETYMRIYSSDKATFYNSTNDFGSHIQRCMQEDAQDCDWDSIFNVPLDLDLRNTSVNALVTEHESPLNGSSRIWCEAIVYNAFPTYTLDTTAATNPLSLVVLNHLPAETDKSFNKTPIAVSPDWVLAAWSVANNGTVDRSREIGKELARVIPSLIGVAEMDEPTSDQLEFIFLHLYTMSQTLSLINYSSSNDTAAMDAAAKAKDKGRPVLNTWTTLRVWAYGLSGRTAKLGVVVTMMGCVCVLLRLFLSVSLRIRHEHTTVELFVAALEHQPTREFDNLDDEAKMAKVRYIMQDGHGRPKFISERAYSSSLSGGIPTP
ncbi:hypothetical protein G7Y79_00012g032310 [Physcia stellaris]|nr:hypothetical protein G7Y79_00012g032310 [Physcia stellaris]